MRNLNRLIGFALTISITIIAEEKPGEQFTSPFGFPLIKTNVVEIQDIFGSAMIVESGHHEEIICFVWPDSGIILTFVSQSEGLSGGFSVETNWGQQTDNCSTIITGTNGHLNLTFGGLRLGQSKETVKEILSSTEVVVDDSIRAHFKRIETVDHPMWGPTPLHIDIYITCYFTENRLAKLRVSKSATS